MPDRRSGRGRSVHDGATRVLSVAMIALGVLLALRGAALAIVLGVAMVGAGLGRLWVVAQRRPPR
jgi:hypothetical protein